MVEKAQDANSEHSISGTSYNSARPSTSSSAGVHETKGDSSTSVYPSRREIFEATLTGERDHVLLPHLRSDPPPSKAYRRAAHSLDEFRRQEGGQREARLKDIWQRLTESRNGRGREGAALVRSAGRTTINNAGAEASGFTREKAERLKDIYDDELLHKCNSRRPTHTRGPKSSIPWKDFYRYAEAKEVGELKAISHFGAFLI